MIKKSKYFFISFIILAITSFVIFDQMKYTTYQEIITEMTDDGETVTSITVEDWKLKREFSTNDKDIIQKILSEPSNMEMKKSRDSVDVDYILYFYTDKSMSSYSMGLGKSNATISFAGRYNIINNKLYQLIENENWNWKNF